MTWQTRINSITGISFLYIDLCPDIFDNELQQITSRTSDIGLQVHDTELQRQVVWATSQVVYLMQIKTGSHRIWNSLLSG